jgi:catalase
MGTRLLAAAVVIGTAVGGTGLAFAYTSGWLSPGRLTPDRMVDALSERGGDPLGHRRNHAKGICFTGRLEANGAGQRLSTAPMFAAGRYPVVGRFAIATGNPAAPDATGRVRSMAIRVLAPDGQEWRSGMNSSPVFAVSTPRAFYDMTLATDLDPLTGRPDPAALPHFLATHPEASAFLNWARTAPWTGSYADQDYNALNAFLLVAADGTRRAARWSMRATLPPEPLAQADLARLGPDFLEADLVRRLGEGEGELRWRLVVTLATPGDPTDDATRAWPEGREQAEVGTLVVERAEAEAAGPCRDYNYDPLVLPAGILPSDDPLLPARSSAYANSFDRRTAETRHYPWQQGGARP